MASKVKKKLSTFKNEELNRKLSNAIIDTPFNEEHNDEEINKKLDQ